MLNYTRVDIKRVKLLELKIKRNAVCLKFHINKMSRRSGDIILMGNAKRFKPAVHVDQPRPHVMSLTIWTQTDEKFTNRINLELPLVKDHGANIHRHLRKKIDILEDSLKQHKKMFKELHADPDGPSSSGQDPGTGTTDTPSKVVPGGKK